jgi:hypothetical protein
MSQASLLSYPRLCFRLLWSETALLTKGSRVNVALEMVRAEQHTVVGQLQQGQSQRGPKDTNKNKYFHLTSYNDTLKILPKNDKNLLEQLNTKD